LELDFLSSLPEPPLLDIETAKTEILSAVSPSRRPEQVDGGSPAANATFNPVAADQVLINLLINAVDALEGAPDPKVTLELSRPAPGRIRCALSDNGPGMSPEVLARATEAFFTTKPAGRGTGLGLAVVKRLVEDAGGSLTIDTSPAGTRVSWELAALPS
jgi:two-component system C4-dicarboxylate transport sensor histidine kinase DctB